MMRQMLLIWLEREQLIDMLVTLSYLLRHGIIERWNLLRSKSLYVIMWEWKN